MKAGIKRLLSEFDDGGFMPEVQARARTHSPRPTSHAGGCKTGVDCHDGKCESGIGPGKDK